MEPVRAVALVVAGGKGVRMGGDVPKQYRVLGDKPVLWHALSSFERSEYIDAIVLVVGAEDIEYCRREILGRGGFTKVRSLVPGGREREDSVRAGLEATREEDALVLVHDAVRPFVSQELIERVVLAAERWGAAVPTQPVVETIKVVEEEWISATPERHTLQAAQTPQGFRRALLYRAHSQGQGMGATDDAMLVERLGESVRTVVGAEENRKLTTPADWAWATQYIAENRDMDGANIRVGQGYDVHRFAEGRALILGGIEIPFHVGLDGHSDADVLTHAIIDALLGTIGGGDIGQLFPDTEAEFKDISSIVLLERVCTLLEERNARVINVDAVVMAQRPKLAPHIAAMRSALATALRLDAALVSVKATTTEQLGFVGREEGIAAQAVALVNV